LGDYTRVVVVSPDSRYSRAQVSLVGSVADVLGIASMIDDEPAERGVQGRVRGRYGRGEHKNGGGTETK
jgi:hypothetical protein